MSYDKSFFSDVCLKMFAHIAYSNYYLFKHHRHHVILSSCVVSGSKLRDPD